MVCERCNTSKAKAARSICLDMYLDKQFKKFDDETLLAHWKIVRDAQAEIPLRFRWVRVNLAVDKLIEELKAEQRDVVDLVHMTLSSVEKAPFDPLKACLRALQSQARMLQLSPWIDAKVISALSLPSLMLEDAKRTLINDTAKKCALSLVAYPLGDVGDVAASHFLSLCQSFRALLALASDDVDEITNGFGASRSVDDKQADWPFGCQRPS